jgi:hypothetical protein
MMKRSSVDGSREPYWRLGDPKGPASPDRRPRYFFRRSPRHAPRIAAPVYSILIICGSASRAMRLVREPETDGPAVPGSASDRA